MHDIRIERWAHTLIHYSLSLKAGETLAIRSTPLAVPLIEAVYGEALHIGAHPIPLIELESLEELLLREGSDDQLAREHPSIAAAAEHVDAQLLIGAKSNTRAMSQMDPARLAKRRQAHYSSRKRQQERELVGKWRRTSTLYPTPAYAQDAEMSLGEFEEFVFDVCFLNDPDPIARWKEVAAQQQRLVNWLAGRKRVHILGKETDLTLSIEGRAFIASNGTRNFPSGEFFTGPV
ncbi:MAG TPA: aminopeptidase, partial [Ktedonobacteraceae bacterium]